jgi:hypothetical protein
MSFGFPMGRTTAALLCRNLLEDVASGVLDPCLSVGHLLRCHRVAGVCTCQASLVGILARLPGSRALLVFGGCFSLCFHCKLVTPASMLSL